MECDIAGGRGEVAVIVAASVALTGLAALVARRLCQMVCRDFILPEPASYVFFYALFNLRKLLYIIFR